MINIILLWTKRIIKALLILVLFGVGYIISLDIYYQYIKKPAPNPISGVALLDQHGIPWVNEARIYEINGERNQIRVFGVNNENFAIPTINFSVEEASKFNPIEVRNMQRNLNGLILVAITKYWSGDEICHRTDPICADKIKPGQKPILIQLNQVDPSVKHFSRVLEEFHTIPTFLENQISSGTYVSIESLAESKSWYSPNMRHYASKNYIETDGRLGLTLHVLDEKIAKTGTGRPVIFQCSAGRCSIGMRWSKEWLFKAQFYDKDMLPQMDEAFPALLDKFNSYYEVSR